MAPPEHSRERDSSRPRASRRTTPHDGPYIDEPESLILPDGPVGEEATELLGEFVHPHAHGQEETLVGTSDDDDDDDELDNTSKRPWWKRPSPWWLIGGMPFTAIAMSCTIAPRIEMYTMLACSVHKPDIFRQNYPEIELGPQDISRLNLDIRGGPDFSNASPLIPIYLPDLIYEPGDTNGSAPTTPRNRCASDPVVQAAVAKLTAVITTSMGILSFVTTGWWGAFSDRYGRARVMGISILGLLVADLNFIGVATFWKYLPGGYWLLVIGPVVEGFLGGMTTGVAAYHSYMADTTSESYRSRVFSLSLGLLFTGMAVGPTLGSLLIHFTGQTISVFYAALIAHIIYTFFIWGLLPESLSQKRMDQAKAKYASELSIMAQERERNPAVGLLVRSRRLFAFLSPLTIFMPAEEKNISRNPLKSPKKDWNLTLMAVVYAIMVSLMGSYSVKFQYAASTFKWSSEIIGYWLSLIGATRAIFLTAVLPLAIKLFKPKPIVIEIPIPARETTALLEGAESSTQDLEAPKSFKKEIHSPLFDLNLARASLFIDVISYACMGLANTPGTFTLFGVLGAFGSGFNPAMQSVTLALYARRGGTETGRLFGALSVLQALCSQILGPALYGFVYIKTVAINPRVIFLVSVVTVSISFFLLGFVRLPNEKDYRRESIADVEEPQGSISEGGPSRTHTHDGTLVDETVEDDSRAPRKRNNKVTSYGAT